MVDCTGEVKVSRRHVAHPERVPVGYTQPRPTPDQLGHLQWLMKKDSMRQVLTLLAVPYQLLRFHICGQNSVG